MVLETLIIYAVDWEIPDRIGEDDPLPEGITDCYWLVPEPALIESD